MSSSTSPSSQGGPQFVPSLENQKLQSYENKLHKISQPGVFNRFLVVEKNGKLNQTNLVNYAIKYLGDRSSLDKNGIERAVYKLALKAQELGVHSEQSLHDIQTLAKRSGLLPSSAREEGKDLNEIIQEIGQKFLVEEPITLQEEVLNEVLEEETAKRKDDPVNLDLPSGVAVGLSVDNDLQINELEIEDEEKGAIENESMGNVQEIKDSNSGSIQDVEKEKTPSLNQRTWSEATSSPFSLRSYIYDRSAFIFKEMAVAAGRRDALYDLAVMYENGKGIQQDFAEALKYYEFAANQGDPRAQCYLGQRCEYRKEYKEAFEYYQSAAVQNYAPAQCCLGCLYEEGRGVGKDDTWAFFYYKLAAEKGDARAQVNLGLMYENGKGVEKSDRQAVACYRQAEDQNYPPALYKLGLMYERGQEPLFKSEKIAVRYYLDAAKKNFAPAQRSLGWMYEHGNGVEKSRKKAIEYYQLAANQGDKQAQEYLENLKSSK